MACRESEVAQLGRCVTFAIRHESVIIVPHLLPARREGQQCFVRTREPVAESPTTFHEHLRKHVERS